MGAGSASPSTNNLRAAGSRAQQFVKSELRYEHKALIPAAPTVIVVVEVMIAFVGTETGIDTHEVAGVVGRPRALIPGDPRIDAKQTGPVGGKIRRDPRVKQPIVRYERRAGVVVGRDDAVGGDAFFDPGRDGVELVPCEVVGGRPASAVSHVRHHEQTGKVGGVAVHLLIQVAVPARNGGAGEDAVIHGRGNDQLAATPLEQR